MTPLQQNFGKVLEELSAFTLENWAWPSPESGFAHYILKGSPDRDLRQLTIVDDSDDQIAHAPSLAALGYAIASGQVVNRDRWIRNFDRLRNRNAFPSDRQSFAYRPLELFGIALGIAACGLSNDASGRWLANILQRTRKEHVSPWPASLQLAAETAIGMSTGRMPSYLDAESLLDLCAVRWAEQERSIAPSADVDIQILEATAMSRWTPTNVAQSTLVAHVIQTVIRRSILSQVEMSWELGRETSTAEALVMNICRRFHRSAQQLRERHNGRNTLILEDEYDVQDLMHALLLMFFDDVRSETHTPNYAGNSSRTDFVLWQESVVVEIKMTRKSLGQKDVADQLIIDKERYSSDPRCKSLVCFVYDVGGYCENPESLENDLAQDSSPRTRVIVHSSRR